MDLTRRQVLGSAAGVASLALLPVAGLFAGEAAETSGLDFSVCSWTLDVSMQKIFDVLLSHNVSALFLVNALPGTGIYVVVRQDPVGGRTFDWMDNVLFNGDTHHDPSRHADAVDVYQLYTPDGHTWFGWLSVDIA